MWVYKGIDHTNDFLQHWKYWKREKMPNGKWKYYYYEKNTGNGRGGYTVKETAIPYGPQSEINAVEAKNTSTINAKAQAIYGRSSLFYKKKTKKTNVSTKRTRKSDKNKKTTVPANPRAEQHAKSSRQSHLITYMNQASRPKVESGMSFVNQYVSNQKKKRK